MIREISNTEGAPGSNTRCPHRETDPGAQALEGVFEACMFAETEVRPWV